MGNKEHTALKRFLFALASLGLALLCWYILSVTLFKGLGFVPEIPATFAELWRAVNGAEFWETVGFTLSSSSLGFLIAFLAGALLAWAASASKPVHYFLYPVVAVMRALPTIAITVVLLVIAGKNAPVVIGLLIVFPLTYTNMHGAFAGADSRLTEMARIFKAGRLRTFTGVTLPGVLPGVFSTLISGFGLNLKAVISAEIIMMYRKSIGGVMMLEKTYENYAAIFAWLIIVVALSFLFELVLIFIMRLCMPWRYKTRKKLGGFFKAAGGFFKKLFTGGFKKGEGGAGD